MTMPRYSHSDSIHVGIVSNALFDPSMLCATSPDLVLSPLRNSAQFEILLKAPSVARRAQLGSPTFRKVCKANEIITVSMG